MLLMDIGSVCGSLGLVVIMVTAVARVAALIRIYLSTCVLGGGSSGICIICGGFCYVYSGSVRDGQSNYGGPSYFPQPLLPLQKITTITNTLHTI